MREAMTDKTLIVDDSKLAGMPVAKAGLRLAA